MSRHYAAHRDIFILVSFFQVFQYLRLLFEYDMSLLLQVVEQAGPNAPAPQVRKPKYFETNYSTFVPLLGSKKILFDTSYICLT